MYRYCDDVMKKSAVSCFGYEHEHLPRMDLLNFMEVLCYVAPKTIHVDAASWMFGDGNGLYLNLASLGVEKLHGQVVYNIYSSYACCKYHFQKGGFCPHVTDENMSVTLKMYYWIRSITSNGSSLSKRQMDNFHIGLDFIGRVIMDLNGVNCAITETAHDTSESEPDALFKRGVDGILQTTPAVFGASGVTEGIHETLLGLDHPQVGTFTITPENWYAVRKAVYDIFVNYEKRMIETGRIVAQ